MSPFRTPAPFPKGLAVPKPKTGSGGAAEGGPRVPLNTRTSKHPPQSPPPILSERCTGEDGLPPIVTPRPPALPRSPAALEGGVPPQDVARVLAGGRQSGLGGEVRRLRNGPWAIVGFGGGGRGALGGGEEPPAPPPPPPGRRAYAQTVPLTARAGNGICNRQ